MASLLCKQTKAVSYELSIKQRKRGFLCGDYNAKRYPVSIRLNFLFFVKIPQKIVELYIKSVYNVNIPCV